MTYEENYINSAESGKVCSYVAVTVLWVGDEKVIGWQRGEKHLRWGKRAELLAAGDMLNLLYLKVNVSLRIRKSEQFVKCKENTKHMYKFQVRLNRENT